MANEITAIGLTPLHGTILSIIIGAFSAYAISLFWRLDEIVQSVFSEAEKINHVDVAGSFGLTGAPKYQSGDDSARKKLLSRLTKLGMAVPDPELPNDSSERGAEILRIISALSHYYPFPTRARPTAEGGVALGGSEPLVFRTIEDVQKWRSDVEEVSSGISWLLNVHKAKFDESIQAFQQAQEVHQPRMELPDDARRYLSLGAIRDIEESMNRSAAIQGSFGPQLVAGFVQMLNQARGISSRVTEALASYQLLKRRVPNKWWFLATIIFGATAFTSAVILPMFCNELPAAIWKGVPVAFYVYSLLIVLLKTVRLLWR